jgi:hypothetical protein
VVWVTVRKVLAPAMTRVAVTELVPVPVLGEELPVLVPGEEVPVLVLVLGLPVPVTGEMVQVASSLLVYQALLVADPGSIRVVTQVVLDLLHSMAHRCTHKPAESSRTTCRRLPPADPIAVHH